MATNATTLVDSLSVTWRASSSLLLPSADACAAISRAESAASTWIDCLRSISARELSHARRASVTKRLGMVLASSRAARWLATRSTFRRVSVLPATCSAASDTRPLATCAARQHC